jgi:aryl-alcohol dehydrogenase-like predicted oxidoreductase
MEYRVLGRTGFDVSRLSMGGLFVSKIGGGREQARAAIHRALQLGVNYLDTAPGYLDSEEVMGEALAEIKAPYILSTKLGGRPQPFDPQDADALRLSFAESLRLLKRETVDILMIHEPDRPGQHDWWTDWEAFTGPVSDVLADLKAEGLVRFTGLGGTTPYILARLCATGQFDVVLTAFNYSLLWREAAIAVIPEAVKQGMGIVVGSPLQQGWLSRRFDGQLADPPAWLSPPRRDQLRALYALVDDLGMPLTDLAIRWVISDSRVDTTLMGARSAQEVEMNVAAVEAGPLPPDVMKRLEEIGDLVPFRPFSEPFGCQLGNPGYRGPGVAV